MSYLDIGYNQFFDKSLIKKRETLSTIDAETYFDGIGAESLISSGTIFSQDKRLAMNLSENNFQVNDGTVERIELGKFDDDEYGLRVKDRDGNVLINITGTDNILQSPDGKMQIDLTNKQIRVYDDSNLRVIMGEF